MTGLRVLLPLGQKVTGSVLDWVGQWFGSHTRAGVRVSAELQVLPAWVGTGETPGCSLEMSIPMPSAPRCSCLAWHLFLLQKCIGDGDHRQSPFQPVPGVKLMEGSTGWQPQCHLLADSAFLLCLFFLTAQNHLKISVSCWMTSKRLSATLIS